MRVVEQRGGLGSPARAAEIINGLNKALTSSNGTVTPEDYQTFLAAAKTAGNRLSSQSLYSDFEPIIAEMRERAGTGLSSVYTTANGNTKRQSAMNELIRLGAWDKSKIIFNKVDGVKAFKNGANPLRPDLANLLADSPLDFYREIRKMYVAKGVKDIQLENARVWGGTGGALFNEFEKKGPKFFDDARKTYAGTMNLDDVHKMVMDGMMGSQEKLAAEWDNLKLSLAQSGGALDLFTRALSTAASALSWRPGSGISQPVGTPGPPSNWRGVNLSTMGGPMALPTITPMRQAPLNPAFSQAPRGPVSITINPPAGASPEEIAKHTKRLIDRDDAQQARSTYNGGR